MGFQVRKKKLAEHVVNLWSGETLKKYISFHDTVVPVRARRLCEDFREATGGERLQN